ncbi:MAG: hypothetical protein ACP5U2_00945 [Bryobacteraceae bacterium]
MLAASLRLASGVVLPVAGLVERWTAWWVALYHRDRLAFTLLTVLTIVLVGSLLGILTDSIMRRLGIDLNSRQIGEQ